MTFCCENKRCCYGVLGGTSKCSKCDKEYKEWVLNNT